MPRQLTVLRAVEAPRRFRILVNYPLMYPEEREAWCTYLRRHGVDPGDVAVPGMLTADDGTRTLSWLAYDVDEHGRVRYHGLDPVHVTRTVQLEAPALPFPDDAPDWPWS